MDKDTLNKKLTELKQEFESKKKEVLIEYCKANNPYNVGDKFTDNIGSIIIENIKYSLDIPCCVYFGAILKKDGTPKEDTIKRNAWQISDRNNKTQVQ